MKKLKDFEKEISKCSKCGLCQAACPVFEATGNECAVSKGKFVMLQGVLKGDLKLSEKINSYLDLCLKCNKCSNFCPAGIDVCEILQTAQYEYLQAAKTFPLIKFLQSEKVFERAMNIAEKLTEPFRKKSLPNADVLYFKGCANKVYPRTENALKTILNQVGIGLIEAPTPCCGLPMFSSGNLERFEELKAQNTKLINESNAKYLLTDCASCESTLKSYQTLNKSIVNAETLIADLNLKFHFKTPQKVTFHRPCHLENIDFLPRILKNCQNVEFIEIPESCCGFAGEFGIKKPTLSHQLAQKRAQEIAQCGADIVLTSCPSCIIGLKKALLGKNIQVLNIIDFLAKGEPHFE